MSEKKSKKYEIVKNGVDDYILKYKDKEIHFNSKVEYVSNMQEIVKNARLRMMSDLTDKGMTIDKLKVVKEVNGETIVDTSNLDYMEDTYIKEEQAIVVGEIFKKMLNVDYQDLILDMGLNPTESRKLGEDIGTIIKGTTPSK